MRHAALGLAIAALAAAAAPAARAETNCELAAQEGKTIAIKGRIKSSDWDRVHNGYFVIVDLGERCNGAEVNMMTTRRPRCGEGASVSVTGRYSRSDGHTIESPRIVCRK